MELSKGVKALIFDFDGTLFQLENMNWDALSAAIGQQDNENFGQAMQRLRLENPQRLEIVTDAEIRSVGKRQLEAPITDTLDKLAQKYKIAVLTRNSRRAVSAALAGLPAASYTYVVGREDTERLKPHPEGALHIMRRFGVAPDEVLWVGDTYHDVQAAKAADIKVIVVKNPRLAYVPEGADHYIDSITDLLDLLA